MNKAVRSLFFVPLILLAGCTGSTVYHSYSPLPPEGWSKSDTLFHTVSLQDSLPAQYLLSAEIRNNGSYPYRDIYLLLHHNLADSCLYQADTLHITLAGEEGTWLGSGFGNRYQLSAPWFTFTPSRSGIHTFKLTHGMQDTLLKGIPDIGLKIEKQ
ncbi:MAG: gliding motility lipoprotein GldH [Bacteroides sp.]|nr:gliding motility lipoprotein GldH [Bacteroides sp.]MCD8261004.1 gliding motility lipoprotein GldH [Bacteroides sp.]